MDRKKVKFYAEHRPTVSINSNLFKYLLVFLKNQHFKRFLDIGCADGSFSVTAKEFADEVYGIDIDDSAVKAARDRGILAYKADVDNEILPFEDGFFDCIFAGTIIEHLFDPDHLLDEMYRTLKNGGSAIITTPNLASWHNRILLFFGFQPTHTEISLRYDLGKVMTMNPKAAVGHIRIFTYRALMEMFRIHSFEIVKIIGTPLNISLPFPLKPIDLILSKRASLANELICILKKPI